MTQVMDGVRRATVIPMPLVLSKPRPTGRVRAMESGRYVIGMDGIRRPVMMTPREMLTRVHDVPAPAAVAATAAEWPAPIPTWKLPSLRMPDIAWKRPALAFGLVASALMVSVFGVNALVTPRTTVSAATSSITKAATPAPAAAAAAVLASRRAGLQKLLNDFAAANGGDEWGIVVKDLKTGQLASYNPDRQIESASLYKLFVAQRIYQRIDIGQLDSGQDAGGGSGRNINDCLTIMINISDNTCGRALGSILGWGDQNQALQQEGYKETDLSTPQQTSATDVALLFSRLYDGTLLSPTSTQRFMGLLKDQQVNNRLPQGLPAGTVIAHKTGDLDGVVHDAGIVYGPKTDYLVVVTSGPWSAPGNAPAQFADLSSKLWNFFEQ